MEKYTEITHKKKTEIRRKPESKVQTLTHEKIIKKKAKHNTPYIKQFI